MDNFFFVSHTWLLSSVDVCSVLLIKFANVADELEAYRWKSCVAESRQKEHVYTI